MIKDLRITVGSFIVSLILIRLWIEIVTAIIFKNSNLINQINNNRIGYHHWQLGLLIIFTGIFLGRFVINFKTKTNIILGIGLALFLDQYTYVLHLVGLKLLFEYRSQTDYMVIVLAMIIAGLFFLYFSKSNTERKLR